MIEKTNKDIFKEILLDELQNVNKDILEVYKGKMTKPDNLKEIEYTCYLAIEKTLGRMFRNMKAKGLFKDE